MIAIVDYGLGNVRAIRNIYHRANIACEIFNDPVDLMKADRLILPGVGAFDWAMGCLNESGMRTVLDELVLDKGLPVLGICVGMQIMAHESEEGVLPGLGWMNARVLQFHGVSRPHMGWNSVSWNSEHAMMKEVDEDRGFYFLHSYYFKCESDVTVLASCSYGDVFTAAACQRNIIGVQFHPEKSHQNGTQLFINFARL